MAVKRHAFPPRGLPRFAGGSLDISAVEVQGTSDSLAPLRAVWSAATDGDSNAYGIEFALGTDAQSSDPSHPNAFRITGTDASGKPKLTFGLNPLAAPYTIWSVRRSTSLQPNDWTVIYRYHGPSGLETTTGTSATPMGNLLEVVDDNPPPDAAFYRFEAGVAAP